MAIFIPPGQLITNSASTVVGASSFNDRDTQFFQPDDFGSYLWTLPLSYVGTQIAALPDVAIIGPAASPNSAKFLQDQVQLNQIAVYQRFTLISKQTGTQVDEGLALIATSGVEADAVLAQTYAGYAGVNSFFTKIIVPAPLQDTQDAFYIRDYDDELILAVTGSNGVIDETFPQVFDQFQGRFLVVSGQVAGQRDQAWGQWLNEIDPFGVDPNVPTVSDQAEVVANTATVPQTDPVLETVDQVASTIIAGAQIGAGYGFGASLNRLIGTAIGSNPTLIYLAEVNDLAIKTEAQALKSGFDKAGRYGTAAAVVVSAGTFGWQAYQDYQANGQFTDATGLAGAKFVAALGTGFAGNVIGNVSGALVRVGIGALLGAGAVGTAPLIISVVAGAAAGYYLNGVASQLIDTAYVSGYPGVVDKITSYWSSPFAPQAATTAATPTEIGNQIPFKVGGELPQAQWTFNVDTKEFVWLNSATASELDRVLIQMDATPNPTALNLVGDRVGIASADIISGGRLVDRLSGGGGDDVLTGAQGDDELQGGGGDDALEGGPGRDTMIGGTGNDVYVVDDVADSVIEGAGEGTSDTARVIVSMVADPSRLGGIEHWRVADGAQVNFYLFSGPVTVAVETNSGGTATVWGTDLGDQFTDGAGNDTFIGMGGNDTTALGAGNDVVDGKTGFDTIVLSGARGTYDLRTFLGGDGRLYTNVAHTSGNDTLVEVERILFGSSSEAMLAHAQRNHGSNASGSRFDDVLLQHSGTGQVYFARMVDGAFQDWGAATGTMGGDGDWKAVSSGDVNPALTGGAETFVQQQSTGTIYYASLDTGSTVWGVVSTSLTADWKLRAAADVNGDASADAIVQNQANGTIYFANMLGGMFQNWGVVNVNLTGDWVASGAGDVNGDGFADVVVQQQSTGTTYYANMANGVFSGWGVVSTNLTADWKVKAVADVTGDGFAEVIFQNSGGGNGINPGTTYYADLKTGTVQYGVVTTTVNANWKVEGTADVDNDGFADVLFQNSPGGGGINPGTTYYANMGPGGFEGWGAVATNITAEWHVV